MGRKIKLSRLLLKTNRLSFYRWQKTSTSKILLMSLNL